MRRHSLLVVGLSLLVACGSDGAPDAPRPPSEEVATAPAPLTCEDVLAHVKKEARRLVESAVDRQIARIEACIATHGDASCAAGATPPSGGVASAGQAAAVVWPPEAHWRGPSGSVAQLASRPLRVVGDHLFVADGAAVHRFDVRDAAHPEARGVLPLAGWATHQAAVEGVIVAAADDVAMPSARAGGRAAEIVVAATGSEGFAAATRHFFEGEVRDVHDAGDRIRVVVESDLGAFGPSGMRGSIDLPTVSGTTAVAAYRALRDHDVAAIDASRLEDWLPRWVARVNGADEPRSLACDAMAIATAGAAPLALTTVLTFERDRAASPGTASLFTSTSLVAPAAEGLYLTTAGVRPALAREAPAAQSFVHVLDARARPGTPAAATGAVVYARTETLAGHVRDPGHLVEVPGALVAVTHEPDAGSGDGTGGAARDTMRAVHIRRVAPASASGNAPSVVPAGPELQLPRSRVTQAWAEGARVHLAIAGDTGGELRIVDAGGPLITLGHTAIVDAPFRAFPLSGGRALVMTSSPARALALALVDTSRPERPQVLATDTYGGTVEVAGIATAGDHVAFDAEHSVAGAAGSSNTVEVLRIDASSIARLAQLGGSSRSPGAPDGVAAIIARDHLFRLTAGALAVASLTGAGAGAASLPLR